MNGPGRKRYAALIAVAAAVFPAAAGAQDISIGAIAISANHELLGQPLVGGGVRYGVSWGDSPFSARVGVDRVTGSARRTGAPCGGFIQPGTCPDEPLRDDARLSAVTGGFAVRLLNRQRVTVSLIGDVDFASVRVDTRGLTSGDSISATQILWGPSAGVELAWLPWTSLPLALDASISAGAFMPVAPDQALDGYVPFHRGFGAMRFRLNVRWARSVER